MGINFRFDMAFENFESKESFEMFKCNLQAYVELSH